jgi:hypothetical protein
VGAVHPVDPDSVSRQRPAPQGSPTRGAPYANTWRTDGFTFADAAFTLIA